MIEILLFLIAILLLVNLFLSYRAQSRVAQDNLQPLLTSLDNLEKNLTRLDASLKDEFSRNREETSRSAKEMREELNYFTRTNEEKFTKLTEMIGSKLDIFQQNMEVSAKSNRDELTSSLKSFQEQFRVSVAEFNDLQKQKFDNLTTRQTDLLQTTEQKLEKMREVIETKLKSIQDDNTEKLELMRQTVDEKLQKTLEDKLGESFKLVSDRLEQVHKGLGEMQVLASGVGDLKKVLSNVRTSGSLGEYRLEMILEQILAPEQYGKAVATKPGSRENVEFVIKIPSKETDNEVILLPIDSKFPQEKYYALIEAYDKVDPVLIEEAVKELDRTIKGLAKDIRDKYINPPVTTDFAIMFLPFEGLYAEVVKRPTLFESLQNDFRITVVGPSTLAAFLHSLYMGFRTLAIQKRSSEVWALLGAIKTEFGKFAMVLDGVEKNLQVASNKIQEASRKSRTIERKLKGVETLPQTEVVKYLGDGSETDQEDTDFTEKQI